jgi:hypothetical protein
MSVKNKTSLKSAKVWQRHALAKACVLAITAATAGSAAWAVDPGAALLMTYGTDVGAGVQTLQGYWPRPLSSSGYNNQWVNPQIGSADIMAPITNATYFSSLTGSGGSYPVSIVSNTVLASVLVNQATNTMTTLNRTGISNDGDLSLNLQIFTGLVDSGDYVGNVSALATLDNRFKLDGTTPNTDGTVYINQAGLASANLSLSNNSMGASVGFNSLNTAVTVATPSGYTSSSKGTSDLSFSATGSGMGTPAQTYDPAGDAVGAAVPPVAGSTGSVNLSNLQGAFNAAGTAEVQGVMAKIAVSGASSALDKAIDLNGNSIAATSNSNSAVSVFTSTAASAAFTGTVGVSNSQAIASGGSTPEQYAGVSASSVELDVRKAAAAATQVTGSISVNDNVVSAKATGNTAGSQTASGSILAGNAIVFEGSSSFTGANTTRGIGGDLTASIAATTAIAGADLLINSAQRVADNDFSATLATPKVTVNMDNLSSNGSLTQNGNTLSASVVNNLAGNLISVGQSASMGSMTGSTVVLNTQQTKTVETLASVSNGEISAQIGYSGQTVDGSASLNSNAIAATAQGNLAVSSVLLKADNLSVGANGATNSVALTPSTDAAVSGLAVSTLNVQSNNAQSLSAQNTTGSVKLTFDDAAGTPVAVALSGAQATVNSNQLTSTATGNSASNRTVLQSTNAANMNVAVGSSQTNTNGSIEASSGFSNANKLSVQLDALSTVNGSQLGLSSNTISAQAQINSVSNSLSTTLTNTSGVTDMLINASSPSAIVGDLTSAAVTAKADFALANAQAATTTSATATSYGAMTLAAGDVGATTASTLVANSNSIAATAEGNSASNAVSLTNANMSGMTAALASGQLVSTTPITASTTGQVAVSTVAVGATGKASSVSVNDNAVTASSVGNLVTNSMGVTATTALGRAVNSSSASPSKTIASSATASAKADFALSNSQVLTQTSGVNDIYSTVTGSVQVTTEGDVNGASTITMDANSLTASSMGNSAGNTLSLSVGQLSQADLALASMQTATLADISANNTGSSIALTATTTDKNIADASKLTVTKNLLKSTALANTVTNQVTVSGTNLTAPSLTLADKGAVIGTNTTVVATSALANDQTSTTNTLTSSVGVSGTPSSVLLQANDVSGASVLTLSDNTLASVAYNNNATNGMTLAVTNATGATGALASKQSVDTSVSGSSKSETFGSVKLAAGDVAGTSNLTVTGNSITADNVGNSAANQMAVTASQWDGRVAANGRVVPSLAAGTSLNTTASADLAVANQQNVLGAAADTAVITANVVGTVENNFTSLTLGNITSNANTVSAVATGSTASNALTMSTTGMTGTTLGVASLQVMDSGKISSTAKTGTLDVGAKGTSLVAGGNVSVNDNVVQATSQANAVSNSLSVTATNATGTTATVVPTSAYDLTTMTMVADMALVNNQATLASTVEATAGTSSAAPARIKSDVGAVSLSTNASNLTLNGNSVASAANANRAGNSVAVAANSMIGMTAGLGNAQMLALGSLDASTYGKIDSQLTSIANSNASVNSNAITASALGNNATNSLSVSGSNASGRAAQPSFTMWGAVTVADLVLNNAQALDYNTLTATTDGDVQLISAGAVTGASGPRSNLSLNTNTISAYGSSNFANNNLLVSPNSLTNATSALVSMQAADRIAGPGTINSVFAVTTGSALLQAGAVSDANVAMNNNSIQSTALDNVAVNQMNLAGTTATGASLTMTGLRSPISNPSANSVAADASLINLQASAHDGNMKANTGKTSDDTLDAVAVTLQVAGATNASITASENNVSSLLYANNASNTLGMNVTTVTAMTAALSNTQQVSTGALYSRTFGDVLLNSTADVVGSKLTLKDNSITATAGANDAGNKMSVVATDLVGRNLANRAASVGSFQVVTDFALGNQQQLINGTDVTATATGAVHLNALSNDIGTGQLTLSGNSLSATGSANNATNALSMSVTNITQASLGLASEQSMDAGTSVTSTTTGSTKMTAGAATDSALSVADNTIKSTALGNLVTNTLTAAATNYTGPTSSTVNASAASGTTSVAADFAIASKQINDSALVISATTLGTVQMAVDAVTGSTSASSSNSLTGNTLKALAQSNSASNEIKLDVTELRSASAGVASYQSSEAAVNASVAPHTGSTSGGLFAVTSGALAEGSITVSANAVSALAGMNEAYNTLTVKGSNLLARGLAVTAPTVGTVSSTGADFAVMNAQSGSGSAEASLNAGASGFSSTGSFTAGSVTVNSNALLARASANTANNTLTLAASNRLEASGVVNNLQQMADAATVKASIASTSALGVELASSSGEAVVTVKDNTVTAQATGNVANNALNASANNAMTAAGASGTPTFAVLNYQSTGTEPAQTSTPSQIEANPALRIWGVQSAINGISIGGSQLGGALNGTTASASVTGNQVSSVAYGNSANNSVVVSALAPTLNTASASITSVQYNLTSVNATISNSAMQASGAAGSSGANVGISGNSIVAMAVGNRSVNAITGR